MAAAAWPPTFRGMSGQFTLVTPVRPAPTTTIRALDGTTTDLRQFRGRVVILNFWATWCLPCITELPSLDRLAAKSDPRRLAVVAVSIDRKGATTVAPFIAAHRLAHLAIYLDPAQQLGSLSAVGVAAGATPLWGLPITYVIDPDGRVIGYLAGAADWDAPEASKFLRYFLDQDGR
jgi:peroxiredoxin